MIIAIDFDGVIVEEAFPEIGEVLPGAIKTIEYFYSKGHSLILWTSRPYLYNGFKPFEDVVKWLKQKDILYCFDSLNEEAHLDYYPDPYKKRSPKIYADIYIDDKGVGFIKDWNWIKEQVEKHPKF